MCSLMETVRKKVNAFSTLGGMEPGLRCEHIFRLTGSKEKYWQLFPSKLKSWPKGEEKKKKNTRI